MTARTPDDASPPDRAPPEAILRVENLKTVFHGRAGPVTAVDDLSISVRRGETLGLVGESGCGKSVTSLSILRLIPPRAGRIVGGRILYEGRDLLGLDDEAMREVRGGQIAMIFQEPMTALNPVMTVGDQIVETILLHQPTTRRLATERAMEMLRLVRIAEPRRQLGQYPHQLSGGMRQRAMIAMALSCNPKLLIADEPTTALDVTIQAQILELMQELQTMLGTAIVMITHDLGVIAETASQVAVMYAGRKVEEADVVTLFERPRHPYTRGLLKAIPDMSDPREGGSRRRRLHSIDGTVPALTDLPPGCSFAARCPRATARCTAEAPPLEQASPGHWVACWNDAPAAH